MLAKRLDVVALVIKPFTAERFVEEENCEKKVVDVALVNVDDDPFKTLKLPVVPLIVAIVARVE